MAFPYSSYTELAPPFLSFQDPPVLREPQYPLFTPPPPASFHDDPAFLAGYAFPNHIPGELEGVSRFAWDSPSPSDQESFLNVPLVDTYPGTEALSSAHPVTYSTESSYTRMFRGRKSKAASEALDELRPYACDICQAAFARSHDRDRHKRSHTGETPYRCHGCNTGFKRPDARKRHWERDPACAAEDWLRVKHTPEGAKRRARAKAKPFKKQITVDTSG